MRYCTLSLVNLVSGIGTRAGPGSRTVLLSSLLLLLTQAIIILDHRCKPINPVMLGRWLSSALSIIIIWIWLTIKFALTLWRAPVVAFHHIESLLFKYKIIF